MSVVSVVQAIRRQERGWDDPGYPIGIWQAEGVVNGDASGGTRAVQINFRSTSGLPRGLAYSLEQIMAWDTEGTAKTIEFQSVNLDPGFANRTWRYLLGIGAPNSATNTQLDVSDLRILKLFLGMAIDPTTAAGVSVIAANDDGEVISVIARGYIWEPRSVLQLPGGYRRPVDGMFGI